MAAGHSARFLAASRTWADWLPIAAGLVLLYTPSFYSLGSTHWRSDEGAHGPIILAVTAWLAWRERAALLDRSGAAPLPGVALLLPGLLLYALGRSQTLPAFEVVGLMPILAGTLLAMSGWKAVRALWFPILFVAFMVPLPGVLVDALTGPLKQHVSTIAEQILHLAGYPMARSGVVVTIGPYQLLVADACAGLHSMFSLSALGLLFIYLTRRASLLHNAVMLAAILPIAFLANLVRVLLLMLITFHMGDEAGQGFLHGATGILLLLVALAGLIGLDAALARITARG